MNFSQATFSNLLTNWYLTHKRELPWRNTADPYKVWISEILLQQTRVAQGLPYYHAFTTTFPSVFDLAEAPETQVLKLWQGLGYYSRARNLHHSAKYVVDELNGTFPKTYRELLKLKGVGDYTASAIASICYGEPTAVLDGNVFRVLSRVFGIEVPIDSTEGKKIFKQLATRLLDSENPAIHNQAIMEFGALHCKPADPSCKTCPFAASCIAFQQGKIKKLPVKAKKTKVSERHFNYLVFISNQQKTILQQRTGKGIWRGLYEFPLIESPREENEESFVENAEMKKIFKNKKFTLYNQVPIKHVLSHQKLFAKFWIIPCENLPKQGFEKAIVATNVSELHQYPVPVLLEKFIGDFGFKK